MSYKTYLENLYFDPKRPGSYSSLNKLYRAVRKEGKYVLGKTKIRKWLETQETFGLHRQINRNFRRLKVVVPFIDYPWDADTAVMTSFVKDNQDYRYFLLIIDVFFAFRMDPSFKINESSRNVQGSLGCLKPRQTPKTLEDRPGK